MQIGDCIYYHTVIQYNQQELIDQCGIYPSRYLAKKNAKSDELFVVKVEGGYKAITYGMYKVWRNTK